MFLGRFCLSVRLSVCMHSIKVYFRVWPKRNDFETNLGHFSPKYIGMISFVFLFQLEQMQRADWNTIVFGSWVDVISNQQPENGCITIQAWLWKGIKNRGFNQIQNYFFSQMLQMTNGLVLAKNIFWLGAL